MELEKMLRRREKEDDTIIVDEFILTTEDFVGLIEKAVTSNIKTTTLFLVKYQFEDMDSNTIIEQVKKALPIGDDYYYSESNPYIIIRYEKEPRQNCN
jgi:hypothetical protein